MILKGEDKKNIIIKEFAELDKDMLSLLCEETYDIKTIKSAVSRGKEAVVSAIRTSNMYPAGVYAEKIADSVITLYKSKDQDSVEVFFDDFDLITTRKKKEEVVKAVEAETADIDELIDDDYKEGIEDKPAINKIDSSLKVNDEDTTDMDEES